MAVFFLLHGAVFEAELAHQLHTPDLEPDGEVRVIHHAHVVGLGVANAQFGFAGDFYFVVHLGLRFSKKLVMPSLKSAVWRMAAFSRTACATCLSSCSLV